MCSTVIKCMLPLVGATRKQVGVGLALCMMVIAPTVAGDHGPGHELQKRYEAFQEEAGHPLQQIPGYPASAPPSPVPCIPLVTGQQCPILEFCSGTWEPNDPNLTDYARYKASPTGSGVGVAVFLPVLGTYGFEIRQIGGAQCGGLAL